MRTPPASFLGTLCTLRWLAIAGQAAAVLIATGPLGLALPPMPLWLAIAALAAFNVYASWRVRRGDAGPAETFAHIAVDVAALAWLVGWSGGVTNPFTSLFLLPIAFAALALPLPWIHATAAICGIGYAAAAWFGQPLPHLHGLAIDGFDLHLVGMAVNFLISAGVVLYFFSRLAIALRRREHELSLLRERFARNEGIVALATHAASVAHELNTPLATLTLMLDDLLERPAPADMHEDHATMRELVDVCRDRVRELATPAEATTAGAPPLEVDLEQVIARWQLVRPTIELRRSGAIGRHAAVDPAVGHLLQALLNNAADAGTQAGTPRVDLHLDADETGLRGQIRDYGAGFDAARPFLPGTLFGSSKPDGLGVGLALSHATVERLGGELSMQASDGRGVCVRFHLPAGRKERTR
ncbi:ATP-binding protein [Dokdonella koreensis]|uniref:histidine kinase n=1 Tax=Dokdonella koreensis DS-123 TaxID=1300342 RepID=A0A160DVU1_9GAMM|nr:ATP-binding protein [Dokdonella koreensis]ANB18310.1 Sensor histidine kinase PrrB (RegB) [Dokdonella koreensis DS-123]